MKYVMTAVWGFILIHMLTYVIGSINGIPYNFGTGTLMAIGAIILFYIISAAANVEQLESH